MKRKTLIILALCLCVLSGCAKREPEKSKTINNEPTVETKGPGKEFKINSGEVYDSVTAVYPRAELTNITIAEKGIDNLIIQINPEGNDLDNALMSYLEIGKSIIQKCSDVFINEEYTFVLLEYHPSDESVDLPDAFLTFKTEPRNGKFRLVKDQMGDVTAKLGTNSLLLEHYPDIVTQMNKAIKKSGFHEIQ